MVVDLEARVLTSRCRRTPAPAEVYAALWLGALLVATGELRDPFPPHLEELPLRYFEAFPPHTKA